MIRITSLDDPRVEHYQQLANPAAIRDAGLFVVEGRLVVRRLLDSPRWRPRSILVTAAARIALMDKLSRAPADVPIYVVDQTLMNEIAGFNIHRGCLALAERPSPRTLSLDVVSRVSRVVVLEGVNNPDNVGGIFRSAAAFGADLVILGPHCGDPLYRKAVRTSMGAVLQVPFVDAGPWPDALELLRRNGVRVLALTPDSSARPIDVISRRTPRVAIVLGAEGDGLSAHVLSAADDRVRIPMAPHSTDSLNVAVAASIALHHFHSPAS